MTQKGLARHINAIRRIQSRLGTSSRAKGGNARLSTLFQEQAAARLLDKLHPTLNLCGFHPFTQQIQFDLAAFDRPQIAAGTSALTATLQTVAENGPGKTTDVGPGPQAATFYQHISQLVLEIEQVRTRSRKLPADKEVTAPTGTTSSVSLAGQFPERRLQPKPAGGENRTGKKPSVTAPDISGQRAPAPAKQRVDAEWSVQANDVTRQFTTVFQKIVENMQDLEQATVASPAPYGEKSMPFPGGKAVSATTTPSATISPGSQTMLHRLTDAIWLSQANFTTARTGPAGKEHNIREMMQRPLLHHKTNDRKNAANPEQKSIAAAVHGGKIARPARPLVSPPSAETSFTSPVGLHTAIHPLHGDFSFQDVGRLEALKVADALSEYLQEQADLNGVDLS